MRPMYHSSKTILEIFLNLMEKSDTPAANSTPSQQAMDEGMTLEDFIASGRTGRRNAMPDILDSHKAGVGTSQIAYDMEKLNCSDNSQVQATQQTSSSASTSQGS